MKIFKFGGASIKDASHIINVGSIIKEHSQDDDLVIVASALGKMTNALEKVITESYKHQPETAAKYWENIFSDHCQIAETLGVMSEVQEKYSEFDQDVHQLIQSPCENYDQWYDQIICFGELMSTTILSAYLNKIDCWNQWIDAREIIITDNKFRAATVAWEQTLDSVTNCYQTIKKDRKIMLTQGFIGSDGAHPTSLGREGSDYTAAILSFCLDAESVTVWKDVPGVLSGDPKLIEHAELLPKLSYREAIELTYYGAKVIHPKTIQPLQRKDIPLHVRSFVDAGKEGTIINARGSEYYIPMVVITEDQHLMKLSSKDFSFIAEQHLSELFRQLNEYRIRVNLMKNSAISFTICVSAEQDRYDKFKEVLKDRFNIEDQSGLTLITLRHYNQSIVNRYKNNRTVLFEEIQTDTYQMVVK